MCFNAPKLDPKAQPRKVQSIRPKRRIECKVDIELGLGFAFFGFRGLCCGLKCYIFVTHVSSS